MAFFKFLKSAVRVLTVVLQVLVVAVNTWDAAQAGTAGA